MAMLFLVLVVGLVGVLTQAQDESSVAFYFKSEPMDTWVSLGDTLTLSCSTSTDVEKTWTWRKHSSTADSTGEVLEGSGDVLEYGPANMDLDNTFISCSADVFGTQLISRYALVRVSYLDSTFQVEPSDATVSAGSDVVRLECVPPGGNPPTFVTWTKNGEDLDAGNSYVDPLGGLNILNVEQGDEGVYTCVANNLQGEAPVSSRSATLTVSGTTTSSTLPVAYDVSFAYSRYRITANEGEAVRVLCGFIGNPTPTFSLDIGTEGVETSAYNTWGTISSLSADTTSVTCEGRNSLGTQIMNIPVHVTGTLQVEGGRVVTILEGEELTMVCSESLANGEPIFSWYKNGQRLDGQTSRVLEIANPTRTDSGMYQCFGATLYAKEQSTFAVTVSGVVAVPVKVTVTSEQYGLMGATAQLSCVGEGNPVPSVTWHRKDANSETAMPITQVVYVETFTQVLAILNIDNVSMEDDGVQYICKGDNSDLYDTSVIYRADSSITMQVVDPIEPSISLPSSSSIKSGTPLTLYCSVEGSPPPTIEWFLNDVLVEGAEDETYVTDGGAGIYKCRATNLLGTVEQEVIVESRPTYSGGEIFLILLITAFLLVVVVVMLLILVRRNELERRMKEANAKDELLLENEKRGYTPTTPQVLAMTPSVPAASTNGELGMMQEGVPVVTEVECQTPRSILSPRPQTPLNNPPPV